MTVIYRLLTWLVLLLGLAGSGALSFWIKSDIDTQAYQEFVSHCEEIKLRIVAQLKAHEQTLLGGAALFDASETVERQEWRAYVERILINEHFKGVQGLGFVVWLLPSQLAAHEARIRAEGFPNYKVYPEGKREAYAPVVFIEPFNERNLRAFGYDIYSEPVRRAAIERAADENRVILSGKITLVQETDKNVQAGTLMLVPVYKKGHPIDTLEQRRAALFGWVYSPFRMTDLLANIVLPSQSTEVIHLHVYDGSKSQAEHLLYDNNPDHPKNTNARSLLVELTNDFNGTIWTLQFEQIIGANGLDYSEAWIALGTGVFISLLLFLLLNSYLTMRVNAAHIAAKLTRELQESESRFRVLADNAPVLIWLSGLDKLCYQFNKVWLDFTGRTLEQEYGNGWAEGVHPDDLQHCLDIYISSFDARLPFKMEYRLRRYDGEYRWLLDNGVPRFSDDGSFLGYIGSCVDITEKKQSEYALQRESEKNAVLLRNASDGICILDFDGNITELSDSFSNMLGYSREEMIGMNVIQWDANFSPDDCIRIVRQQFEKPVRALFETRHRCKDGTILEVEVSGFPLELDGKPALFNTTRDITQRKHAEYLLHRESEKNRALLRNASDGIHILDIDGNILEISDSFSNMLGYSHEEMIGMNVSQWDALLSSEECLQIIRQQATKQVRSQFETRHRCKDGSIIDVEISGFSLKLDDKPILFFSSRDITERKRVENALQENQVLLQTAQRAARLGHYVIDVRDRTNPTWTNDALFDEIFGLDEHYIRSFANLSQIIHPDDLSLVEDNFQRAICCSPQHPTDFIEHRIIRPNDGEERWIGKWGYVFFDDQENSVRQVGMIQDITKRKQLEEQVHNISLYTRNLIEVSLDPLVTISANGKITDVNKATEKVTGFLRDQLINSDFSDYFTDPEQARTGYLEVFSNGYVTDYPLVIKHRDGHLTDVLYNATVYKNERGEIAGVFAAARDITERKHMEEALKTSEEKFRSIIDLSPVPMALNDAQQNIIFLNPAFTKTFGYDLNDIPTLADWWVKAYPEPEYRQWVVNTWQTRLEKAEREHCEFPSLEINIQCKDNRQKIVLDNATMLSHTFNDVHLVVLYDITELKQNEAELRIAATVFESQEGMLITDAHEIILNVNQAFTQITGYSAAEVIGQTPRLLYSGRHDKEFYAAIWQSIKNTGAWHGEIWNRRKNGEIYPEQLTITAVKGNNDIVTNYVATLADITERKAMEEYIHRLAFYDALTQLPNRRLLQERLKHGIELNHRTGSQMAVLMMDLDKFKAVNDSLGHAAGDELLQQVAVRVKARLREVDMVARLGGDEFVILLENVGQYENVANVAQSIIDTLSQPFMLSQGHEVFIGATIGIGICPHHGSSVETLIDNADAALYHAKDSGRGCFAYFSEALTQKAHERLALESRLRGAIEQHELGLYFQPQIEINSGRLVGAEVLVYWDAPVKCQHMMLKDFIALAEETGVAVTIGEWALRETCKLGRQWLNKGLPVVTLAVNISPYQFRRGDIKNLVTQVLDDTDFPSDYLGLEITETGLMANQEHALSILNSLNAQSVQLAIDDFGTGYSSLVRLKSFPIDILKIDKTFINDIPFSQDDNVITSTIIDMAHHLGFKVLAEGVETPEQLAFLREQGCDYYQGDLYSKALSAHDFSLLLSEI